MPESRPDILLIILDTLRRDHLSAYGHTRPTSPEFDALAAEATLFTRAVAAGQWTVPSHGSMFTGLYPGQHRSHQASSRLADDLPTLAEILRAGGYHTAAFCNNPLVGVLDNGLQRGFDRFYNYASAVPHRPRDETRGPLRRALVNRFRPHFRRVGNMFANSDEAFRLSLHPLLVPIWSRAINFKGSTAHSIDDLIAYHAAHHAGGADAPLFVFLNLMGAHLPYRPPQDIIDRLAPGLRRDRRAYDFMRRFNADAAAWATPPETPLEDWQVETLNAFYDAEIAAQDAHLGRLLRHLRERGRLDNTLVVIAADHGEGHGEHELFGHGFAVHQELVHVPLVVRHPDLYPVGGRVTTNVSTRRLFHSLLEAARVRPPLDEADPNADLAGLSLAAALRGGDAEHDLAFSEAYPPLTFVNVIRHRSPAVIDRLLLREVRRGIYDGRHKLTTVAGRIEHLYDLDADPAETDDLAAAQPSLAAALHDRLRRFIDTLEHDAHHAPDGGVSAAVEEQLRALGYID